MSKSTAKRIGRGKNVLTAGLAMLLLAGSASAGWIQTAAGTYDYLLGTNWDATTINDDFPSTLTLAGAQTLEFGADRTTPGDINFNYGGNFGLTLRSDAAAPNHTLTLGGNVYLATSGGTSANVTFGSTTANQNLNVDLGGATRTFDIATGRTLTLTNAVVGSGGLIKAGAGELRLISAANTFVGDISVTGGTLAIGSDASMADSLLGNEANNISLTNASFRVGTANSRNFVFNPRRTITVSGNVSFVGPTGYSNNFQDLAINGNMLGSGSVTFSGASTLLGGNNTGINQITLNTVLRISSEANLGNPTSAFAASGFSAKGFAIMGTGLTNLSTHTFPWASNQGIVWDIQDPDNTFTWDKNFNVGMNSSTSSYVFKKSGAGTLVVTTAQTYNNVQAAAPDTLMDGGVLKIDYTAGGSLSNGGDGNHLGFSGGTLYLLGKSDADVTQNLANVKLLAGGGMLVVDNHSGTNVTTVNLGNFTALAAPAAGSTLNIKTLNPGTGSAVVTTTATNTAGLLGAGRIVFNGTSFAANLTDTSGGTIGAYSGATAGLGDATVGSTTNYLQSGSAASPGATTYANSLKIVTTGAGQGIDLNGQEYLLTSGAVLFAGANDYAVTNGIFKSANSATTSDLIIHQYGSGTLTLGAVIANGGSGASTLTIAGDGKVVLTTANTYTGQTYVQGATLSISANNQLSGTTTTVNLFGATLQATETFSTGRAVVLGGGGGTFDVADTKTLTVSGALSGGRLTLANSDGGNGTLVLSGSNSFASGVAINGGILRLGHNNAFGTMGFNTLSFGSAATQTLQINGARTITVAGLTSAATTSVIENGAAGAAILNVYNGADNSYAGVLRDGAAGTLALTKAGAGTLTLSNVNTYTGATAVYNGILRVNGSLAAGSAVTVASSGTLGGTGTVAGSVTVAAGGSLAPGASVGTLNTGSLSFTGGRFAVEVNTSNDTADKVVTSGDVSLGNGVASLDLSFSGPGGSYAESFTLIDNTSANATTGYFAGLQPLVGSSFTYDSGAGLNFTINYAGGTGNDVTVAFTSVPEPTSLALVAVAGLALLARRRR